MTPLTSEEVMEIIRERDRREYENLLAMEAAF